MLVFDTAEKRSVLVDLDGSFASVDGKFRGASKLLPFYQSLQQLFEKTTDPDQEIEVVSKDSSIYKMLVLYKSSDPTSVYQRYHADPEEQKLDHES